MGERLARHHDQDEETVGKARVQMCWPESFCTCSLIFTTVYLRQCGFGDPPSPPAVNEMEAWTGRWRSWDLNVELAA